MTRRKSQRKLQQEKLKNARAPIEERLPAYLQKAILFLGCFILFLPLVVDHRFYQPYVFYKSILFRTAVQVMVFLYVVLALCFPSHRPRLNRISYALMGYFGIMLICSLPGISIGAWNSWWGDFARMGGMFTQLHLLAYFLVLSQTFKLDRDWLTLFTASLFFSVFMGLTGAVQYEALDFTFRLSNGYTRLSGATGNADFFSAYMLLSLFLSIYFLCRKDKKEIYPIIAKVWLILLLAMDIFIVFWDLSAGDRIISRSLGTLPLAIFFLVLHGASFAWFKFRLKIWSGIAFLGALGIYHLFWMYQSQTRAGVVALAGSLVFVSVLYLWKGGSRRLKWAAVSLFLLLSLLPFAVLRCRNSEWVRKIPVLVRLSQPSSEEHRLIAWKAGIRGMLDHPVWGWGLEHYQNAFDLHVDARIFAVKNPENWYDRAHNMILDIGVTTGCMGLAACSIFYVFLFYFLLRRRSENDHGEAIPLAGLLATYLLQNLFSFDTLNTDVILFLTLAYVAHLYGKDKGGTAAEGSLPGRVQNLISGKHCAILLVSAGILVCGFLYLVQEPYESNLLLNSTIALGKSGNYYGLIDMFQKAEAYATTGRYEVREELAKYASELAHAPAVSVTEKTMAVKRALDLLQKSIAEVPSDTRHDIFFATFVNNTFGVLNQSDPKLAHSLAEKNLTLLQKAESLGPSRPRVFLERSQTLLYLQRTDEAIPALQRAIALDPEAVPRRVDLVALFISAGRYSDAQREWQNIRSLSLPLAASDYDRIIGLYLSKKQFQPVIALYGEQLHESPDNQSILTRLAEIQRLLDNPSK
jgi:tetratricopeptide (TPR) repeat protein